MSISLCSPGELVLYRDVQRGGVWWVIPHVVVADDGTSVALYTCPGTPTLTPNGLSGKERWIKQLTRDRYTLAPSTWEENHVLRLLSDGAEHDVELYWSGRDWRFLGWYVHMQTPFERTAVGFDKRDRCLDIVITPDKRWSWKDEDDLSQLLALDYLTAEEVAAARAEGEKVLRRIDAWASPFCDAWEEWRPDRAWPTKLRAVSPDLILPPKLIAPRAGER